MKNRPEDIRAAYQKFVDEDVAKHMKWYRNNNPYNIMEELLEENSYKYLSQWYFSAPDYFTDDQCRECYGIK